VIVIDVRRNVVPGPLSDTDGASSTLRREQRLVFVSRDPVQPLTDLMPVADSVQLTVSESLAFR
jgi:hypothetical protein